MLFRCPARPAGKLPIQARKRALSRFALGKFPGSRGGHTSPLCSAKGLWRAFALCSGKAAGRGLSRFALAKPGGPHFPALLWQSPPSDRTFGLCSGEVRWRGGLSDFALAKSGDAVDFPTLLWKSQRARSAFALCSGEARAHRFSALLCETDKAEITPGVVFDKGGGCESLGATRWRPRPRDVRISDNFRGGGISLSPVV